MTRFCQNMGLACAMVLVAGTVVTAKDSAAASSNGASTSFQVPAGFDAGRLARVGECDDESVAWDNGQWDGISGQLSHEGGAVVDGIKAADDFFLCPGNVWDLRSICGCMITNSKFANGRARLELYADCNGVPGELLYTFDQFQKEDMGPIGDGYYLVNYCFDVDAQDFSNCNDCGDEAGIVLRGGNYWVALVGLTDGSPNNADDSFFATANNGIIRQAVAHTIYGVEGFGTAGEFSYSGQEWISLADEELCSCVGCTDLCFTVYAHPCKIYVDNGGSDRQSVPAGSRSEYAPGRLTINSRTADNIGTNPCTDITVCYFEACVYTNCPNPKGVLEVYENSCNEPNYSFGDEPFRGPYFASKKTRLGTNVVTIDNRPLNEYKLEWHDLSIDLPANANYWFSVSVNDTFGPNHRAYWCYNWTCEDDCEIHISPAQYLAPQSTPVQSKWTELSDDMSFLVAIEHEEVADNSSAGSCAADYNRDTNVDVADLFGFINAWLSKCN